MVVSQINEVVEQDKDARNIINHLTRDMLNGAREAFMSLHTEHTVDKKLMPVDRLINMVPLYIYRKGSDEAKRFCKIDKMAKISVDIEGVLFTRGRLIDSMNFKNTGELVGLQFGDLGVQTHLPLIERYSPLACSIADHIHW